MIVSGACLAAAFAAACSLIVTAEPEGDARADMPEVDSAGDEAEPGEDPSVEPPPDGDVGSEDGPPEEPEAEPPEPECGNGVREPPEECDATSAHCAGCTLVTPEGWTRCVDGNGDPRLFRLADFGNGVTWVSSEAECRALVKDELSPVLAAAQAPYLYGFATLDQGPVWECVRPVTDADGDDFFWIGLRQSDGGAEPGGGWAWTGMDESGGEWRQDYVEGQVPQITGDFDDASGTHTNVDCGLLKTQGGTFLIDYACSDYNGYKALCMVRFLTTSG